uniref:Carbonic anhydrase n=1 Tax=Kryptoperidinium triquetrum TaxID=66468 RepID=Q5ENU3_KRYTR|nr:chloroplast carbonic anhydrase [Heterocapsa triquetra]
MALVVASVAAVGAAAAGGVAVGVVCSMQKMMQQQLQYGTAPAQPEAPSAPQATAASKAALPDRWDGFSMEEARKHADAGQQAAMARSPKEVLVELQRGNARFWMGAATRPEKSAFERRALISKQFPSVAVLGCSDSRVPVEIVFDQGLGDLFVVRVAGNALDMSTTASLQFAVNHLKVKVVVVMGHEACGAVKAAGLPIKAIEGEPEALCKCLKGLKAGLDLDRLDKIKDPRARDREAVVENVYAQVAGLKQDAGMMDKVAKGEIIIVGAFYEISSGIVDFFGEVSK